ncbi:HTH-type transcriptional regulator SfaX [Escherichia coli]|uniref:HTH-type transcriptional regulator SfaX n=1 Tax=Escherichia coli TaxID=562 RepID=UPI00285C88F1|nr:MarR family transcriptional regulator [Escherichia coli]EFS2055124.1 MarR family transcriptional regulator [Escherichia coli]HBL8067092.1 HTH-type transcriptional regulator SfaX [Escherichia coli]HCL7156404.1 HTH-type transcriptional regulator SfaX [Escherichia coli]HDW1035823.1 HTH-type transcriptional regulator SfaX [Escherichia coli]
MRACTQTVCFSNMENNEMNNTDTLEKIIRHQKNKDPAYPFQEHLLMQLCIRANKRMQDNISEFLGVYGINHSVYMVLTTLFTAESHCLSPSEISQKLQFTRTNITRITDFLEKTGYVKRTDSREDRRAKKISLTSEGMFFIQRLTLAQSMYLKEIWGYLTHDEQELFEVINKKLLAHLDDVSS